MKMQVGENQHLTKPISKSEWADRLNLATFRFAYQALDRIDFSPYAGAVLHGALGRAAQRVSPAWGAALYPTRTGIAIRATPNPFVLRPWYFGKTQVAAGETFGFDITLFGEAARFGDLMCATALALAENGLGRRRTGAQLVSAESIGLGGRTTTIFDTAAGLWRRPSPAVSIADLMEPMPVTDILKVSFLTRCQLIDRDAPCRKAPGLDILVERLSGRLRMIASELSGIEAPGKNSSEWCPEEVASAQCVEDQTSWEPHENEFFGGLVGTAVYRGRFKNFLPLLSLVEWIGLGKKTSFGFGVVRIDSKREQQ